MAGAAMRNSVPPGRAPAFFGFVWTVVAIGVALSAGPLAGLPDQVAELPVAFWAMAALAIAFDARPFTPLGRRQDSAVFPSICFTFAILLIWGPGPAIAVQAAAVLISGARIRYAPWRMLFNIAQYACALSAAYAVARLAPGGPQFARTELLPRDVAVVVLAAVAWFVVNHGLVSTAVRLRFGGRWWPSVRQSLAFELLSASALLLLSPVLVAAARASAALVPLVVVPLYAVYRMSRLSAEQERQARLDPLTGLPNRKALLAEVAEQLTVHAELAAKREPAHHLALLLLDLDRFKHVNDALGHAVGDRLLVHVGERLTRAVRPRDLVARLGGDEFAIVAGGLESTEAARQLADRIVRALANPVQLDGLPLDVGGSIGIALYPDHGEDFETLMRHADIAMYDAKHRGDPVAVYAPESDHNSPERLSLLADLRRVLEAPAPGRNAADYGARGAGATSPGSGFAAPGATSPTQTSPTSASEAAGASAGAARTMPDRVGAMGSGGTGASVPVWVGGRLPIPMVPRIDLRPRVPGEITMYYQPQVAIDTGEVVGVEALLRWRHPVRGLVHPEELIRVAEQSAVMRLLTRRVVDDVVEQLAKWSAAGLDLRAAINVSVRDLHSGEIVEQITGLLDRHGLSPTRLQLEITEGALMADPRRVLATISRLDTMGVAISLDDFGTGYSSLQHLRRLPLAEVKVDRSFVLGMSTDPDDAAIVRSMIELADALGLRVVAEGVEDERTWRLLHAAGCDIGQGWFYARPMPADELVSWLGRYRPVNPTVTADAARHRAHP